MKEYKSTDKVTQKMTRAGAVAENLTTGTAENISGRPADDNFSEQPVNKAGEVLDRADSTLTRRSSKKAAKKARKTINQGTDTIKRPASRLQFSEEERAAPELQKAIRKSDKAANKLDAAREAIPKQKKLIRERTFDEALGKGKTRLRFEEIEKPINGKMKHNPLSRPVQEAGAQIHGKIREVEKENVGVEGGHAVERFGEKAAGKGYRLTKDGIRRHKLKPYRAAAKAERASVKANVNFKYQKALYDNPQLASNPVSRFWQKQQIKRSYAKEIKDAGKTAKNTDSAVKTVAAKAKAAVQKTASFVARHWKGLLIVVAVGLLVFMMLGAVSSFSNLIVGGLNGILGTSYTAEDEDILGAEDDYTALETALRQQIDRIERDYPGYDEYRYNLSEIGHDPFELASYLTARYEDFTRAEIQAALRELFEKQYTLTIVETVEVRYRTETSSWTDDEGNTHTDTYEVAYDYYILTVTLSNKSISTIANSDLNTDQLELYGVYMQTSGNKDYLFADHPYVSGGTVAGEYTDYDIPGEALTDETFAALIREAEKYLGYPYVWGGSSPSTSFDCSGFVCYVLNNSGVYTIPRTTAQGIFNECTIIPRSEAQPGDIIFFTGTYASSGPVSHVGIYVGDGMMIHCGNPISYASIDSNYWSSHFYAIGRLNHN
ncbi:MAG: C40 family peptidase [Lachnospiraceae bacterium]